MTGARGAPLQVMRIVSPGRIEDDDGAIVPASHMNFIIANGAVIAPVYGEASSGFALEALRSLFPERTVIGLPSRAILTGGGSFHCITQQEPA
jgi:agmatine deiminase